MAAPDAPGAFPNIGSDFPNVVRDREQPAGKPDAFEGLNFGILGSYEFDAPQHRFVARWRGALERTGREAEDYAACDLGAVKCDPKVGKWRKLIASLKALPNDVQIERLNASINRMAAYADDAQIFGEEDHWATPMEFLDGRADCEDYALIKFWSLLELGYRDDQVRLAVVRDTHRNIMHAVVTVDLGDKQVVLDNLYDRVVEQRFLLKYAPLYSANRSGQYGHIVSRQLRRAYLARFDTTNKPRVTSATSGNGPQKVRFDMADWT